MTAFIIGFGIVTILTAINIKLMSKSDYWVVDVNNPMEYNANMLYYPSYMGSCMYMPNELLYV